MRNRAQPLAAILLLSAAAAQHPGSPSPATPPPTPMTPMLFMLPSDTHDPWGLQFPVAPPPVNLTAECVGASCWDRPPPGPKYISEPIIAVFDRDDGAIDVVQTSPAGRTLWSSTTDTFANFTGGAHTKHGRTYFMNGDLPPKCHIKDFAKKPGAAVGAADGYLLALFCEGQPHGHNGAVFLSGDIHTTGSFHLDPLSRFNFTTPNFHDHDVQPPSLPLFTSNALAYGAVLCRSGHPPDPPGRAVDRLPDFLS